MSDVDAHDENIMIHDTIHGSYYLPDLAWEIIDTPIFQRLRQIKQTGNTHYVYPGAEHTRFQHSLGVAHLSREFGRAIKLKYGTLISDREILLLCIAGLCHDLGHCAFSHLYDSLIIPMFTTDIQPAPAPASAYSFCHEEASYRLLSKIIQETEGLSDKIEQDELETIGKMIFGSAEKTPPSLRAGDTPCIKWTPSDEGRMWLYEIVSNSRTGIDVDKFDYLKRDCHYSGVQCTFDPQRLMAFFKIEAGHITFRNKSKEIIRSMWVSRDDLHRRVYQHRVVKCIDLMTVEMLKHCADMEIIKGTPLKTAHLNLDAYCLLTDYRVQFIAEQVPAAKQILDRIQRRDLWKNLGSVESPHAIEFRFSQPNIKVALATLQESYIYYIYDMNHASESELSCPTSVVYRELIQQTQAVTGATITLREAY